MADDLRCIAAKNAVEAPYKQMNGPMTEEKLVQDGEVPHSPAATISGRNAEAQAQATTNNSAYIQPRRLSGKANYVNLLKWLAKHTVMHPAILLAHTVVIITDTAQLHNYAHWKHVAPIWQSRLQYSAEEKWFLLYIPLDDTTGLGDVHYTWGAVAALITLMAAMPAKNYIVSDHDATPALLWEVLDLLELANFMANFRDSHNPTEIGLITVGDATAEVNAGLSIFPTSVAQSEKFHEFSMLFLLGLEIFDTFDWT